MLPQRLAELLVGESELDERLEIRLEIADVEPPLLAAHFHPEHLAAALDFEPDRVGELDLAALAGLGFLDGLEDRRREHVTRGDGEVAGRFLDAGFLDQVLDLEYFARSLRLGDPGD